MKPAPRLLLAFSSLTFLLSGTASAKPAQPGPDAVSQRMLDDLVEISGVPGMGAAVWANGKVVWRGSSGYRDLDRRLAVTPKTVFRLASVSKLLAATAVAKLAEQGRLDLDAPIAKTLPWLKNDWPTITPRLLAAHAAGLPHYQEQDSGRGTSHYASDREAVSIFANRPLLRQPGQAYSYSSWGYTVLGALVEQTSGMSFPDYVTSQVTPGLEVMRDATDSANPDASIAYDWIDGKLKRAARHDFSYAWAAGGMAASPQGIVRFGGAMLNDRIVSKASFDRMLVPLRLADGQPAGERGYTVGLGWRNGVDSLGKPIAFHNGITLGARSALVLWRDEQIAASLLSNFAWVSSIEQSASMLAAPFRQTPQSDQTSCPIKVRNYAVTMEGITAKGTASFALEKGICTGTLAINGDLADYFKSAVQAKRDQLRIVGIDGRGGLGRAALITPYGIYDLHGQPNGELLARLSEKRELRLSLLP